MEPTYMCLACKYSTNNRYDYNKHAKRVKHARMTCAFNERVLGGYSVAALSSKECVCGKTFKERTGLWRHKKKCDTFAQCFLEKGDETGDVEKEKDHSGNQSIEMDTQSSEKLSSAIMTLIKQNQDLQKQLIEIAKEGKQIIHNSTTNNNTNNTNHFNLQVFLNETCKDALNMVDFVKLMRIDLSDLEEIGRLGYSDGVSRIFVNGLKELDARKRPIHCSDFKREILYIKEDNVWERDTDEKTLIKQAIRYVEHKNIVQIPVWVKAHPDCIRSSNKDNTKYLTMICESTGGQDQSQLENNLNKIIRNIAREVVIDKNAYSGGN